MSTRLIVSGFTIAFACLTTSVGAQETREPRAAAPPSSFWSWSAVSAWGEISRILLGNWSCSGVYADGPTLESCGALTTVPPRRKRASDFRGVDSTG